MNKHRRNFASSAVFSCSKSVLTSNYRNDLKVPSLANHVFVLVSKKRAVNSYQSNHHLILLISFFEVNKLYREIVTPINYKEFHS